MGFLEPNRLRPQRGYVVIGGNLPQAADDWAIIVIKLEPNPDQFLGTASKTLLREMLP